MNPELLGFDDGTWFFHNIRDEFLLSKSVRFDFIEALLEHYEIYGSAWTLATPNSSASFSADEHNTFIEAVITALIDIETPMQICIRGGRSGVLYCCTIGYIVEDITFKGFVGDPIIIQQPQSLTVVAPDGGEYMVCGIHNSEIIFYKWQYSETGFSWVDASTALSDVGVDTTDTLVINSTILADEGIIRVRVRGRTDTDEFESFSNLASLIVLEQAPPIISVHPISQLYQNEVDITLIADADIYDTVKWYYRVDSVSSWINVPSYNNQTTIVISGATIAEDGYEWEARFTNSGGTTATNVAVLTYDVITLEPDTLLTPTIQMGDFI